MAPAILTAASVDRTAITIYWVPGCSSCVRLKEFVTDHGLEFESVNVLEHPEGMDELTAAGLRGVPAVRNGSKFAYAQSLDDVADLLGVANRHDRLPQHILLHRWDQILLKAKSIIIAFDGEALCRRVIPQRERTIRELSIHVFQVAESFMRQVADDTINARAIYLDPRPDIKTRDQLLAYIEGTHTEFRNAFLQASSKPIPHRLNTHYGHQPSAQVLERGVWHSAQHARQLDFVAAGMGAELQIPEGLYAGLPLPKRLWA
jgi:glutaredoxin